MELPAPFKEMLDSHAAYRGLADVLAHSEPEVSVRVNAAKGARVPAGNAPVEWCPEGFYLDERPAFTLDPALHQGMYYVQDASSMAIAHVARLLTGDGRPVRWLDACAAPGGKTTAALASLPEGSLVVANVFDPRRCGALVENIERWGNANCVVSQGDTAAFCKLPGFFDIVAVDAPCSGEGMMRKEEAAVQQWSPGLVEQCGALQRSIINNVWPSLRPGGVLVYSTCTFNRTENEANVEWAVRTLGAEPIDAGLTRFAGVAPGVDTDIPCAHFFPGRVRGEGLFMAVLRKPGNAPAAAVTAKGIPTVKAPGQWLNGDYTYVKINDNVHAWPTAHASAMHRLAKSLHVVSSGVFCATTKGRDLIPAYPLAHAVDLNAGAFAGADVDYATALAILRGEPVTLPDSPRGIVLTRYEGRPLAFMKNIGNRANNLVPAQRRIQSQRVPDTPVRVL